MIQKPGKPLEDPKSHRPISLLSTVSKVFEKLYLRYLMEIVAEKQVFPAHQFRFRPKHSTIEQVHREATIIRQPMESKQFCPAIFLDMSQAFDRVWHEGLLCKISSYLPEQHVNLPASYLKVRQFQVYYGEAYIQPRIIRTGVRRAVS